MFNVSTSNPPIYILDNKDCLLRFPSRKAKKQFVQWLRDRAVIDYWEWLNATNVSRSPDLIVDLSDMSEDNGCTVILCKKLATHQQ